MKNKKILLVLAAVFLLSSCGKPWEPDDLKDPDTDTPTASDSETKDPENTDHVENVDLISNIIFPESFTVGTYNKDSTAIISLSDSGIDISGENVSVDGNTVTVTNSGTYVFSGKLSNGQIVVDSTGAEKVTLVLNGVDITSSTTAAVNIVQSSDKVELKIAKDSVNILSDASTRSETDESNATVYSQDDLEIESEGTLYVKGNFEKGIHSKDDLEIRESTVYVEALDDGIRGKDSVHIESGNITVYCCSDGIRTNNETDEGKGYIEISGGKIEINAGMDAIQAVTDINISGGDFILVSGGGSINSSSQTDSQWGNWGGFGGMGGFGGGRGDRGGMTPPDQNIPANETNPPEMPENGMNGFGDMQGVDPFASYDTTTAESTSAKAVKATNSIIISGGTFTIDSSDDSIHSNGSVTISGGTFLINSGDDGIHSDTDLLISDGKITVEKSYEGIEGLDITVSGGTISVVASDDGLNAAGGSDQSSMNGRPGQNGFGGKGGMGGFGGGMFENPVGSITITGGTLTVNASGDGVDSNGSLTVTGGYTVVYGPTDSGNGPLDYTSEFLMNGGTFVAMGSFGMAQDVSSGSTQARTFVRVSGSANSIVKITDSKGNLIFETTSPKSYSCILVSTPEMVSGEEYSFYFNGELAGSVAAK
ncbi:MAG: carbohydrate-binding domain-containing protein [Ruminococcaceae bacterium]|nr:carbohydrate-binding domain-containing protein [Oscillospiraceae bacterium]